jgi:hypothetical protein
MQGCFTLLLAVAGLVFVLLSVLRWFEQTTRAVERRQWDRVVLLVLVPFAVWLFPSAGGVAAGRPTPAPRFQPVMGMGSAPKPRRPAEAVGESGEGESIPPAAPPARPTPVLPVDSAGAGPPPGTPAEFLGMPVIPPRPKRPKPAADADKVEKLRRKMREQGMLPPDDAGTDGPA